MGQRDEKIPVLQMGRRTDAGQAWLQEQYAVAPLWKQTDRATAQSRGIVVGHTPGVLTDCLANLSSLFTTGRLLTPVLGGGRP